MATAGEELPGSVGAPQVLSPPSPLAASPAAASPLASPHPGQAVAAAPAPVASPKAASAPASPEKSRSKSSPPQGPPVTRLQMLQFLNARQWVGHSQRALVFTLFLWVWFILLMYMRADVEALFRVHNAVAQHVKQLVAHTSVSGVPLYSQAETPLPCKCSCKLSGAGTPSTPCDGVGNEVFDFVGTLPSDLAAQLLTSHQGLLGPGPAVPVMAWDQIKSVEDAWFWIEHGLLPDFWGTMGGQSLRRSGMLLGRNLVVGGVRARQSRVQVAQTCEVPSNVLNVYSSVSCRSSQPQTGPYGPAVAGVGGADPSGGAFSPAKGGPSGSSAEDGAYDAFFDVERPVADALASATYLRKEGWLGVGTQRLELQALLLNAEAGAYAILTVELKFPFHGRVEKKIRVHTFHALQDKGFVVAEFFPEIVWLVLIGILFLQEVAKIGYSTYMGRPLEYFANLWNYVDWVSIFLGAAIGCFWYVMLADTTLIAEHIGALPRAPLATNLDITSYRTAWVAVLEKAKDVYEFKKYHSLCLFWYTTVISARFLKSCMGQEKLAMFQVSLSAAFLDIVHFVVIFVVIFANFVLSGRVLFGDELEAWSTYSHASSSSVRMLLGSSLFDEMYEVAPVSASVWFWLFIMTMVFVVMNLLLVIIVDNYLTFAKVLGPTLGVMHDVKASVLDLFWRLEWRKDNFMDGEYKACFWDNPYADLQDGLFGAANLNEEMEAASRASCLGLRLALAELEDDSPEGLAEDGHPGTVITSSLELRKISGCDAVTAEHILDNCHEHNQYRKKRDPNKQLLQVRQFVKLLRSHRMELAEHCLAIEQGVEEEQEYLRQSLERLESSVHNALEGFASLREVGVESLVPPPPGQTGVMKASGAFEHSGNNYLTLKNQAVTNTALAIKPR